MDFFINLLVSLGVDSSVFYQFSIFLVSYIAMYFLVFKPYYKAYGQRVENTVGSQESNERVLEEAQEIQVEFESKTRDINSEYKKIYTQARTTAMEEYDGIVMSARAQAKSILDKAQIDIQAQFELAQNKLGPETAQISTQIKTKILNS